MADEDPTPNAKAPLTDPEQVLPTSSPCAVSTITHTEVSEVLSDTDAPLHRGSLDGVSEMETAGDAQALSQLDSGSPTNASHLPRTPDSPPLAQPWCSGFSTPAKTGPIVDEDFNVGSSNNGVPLSPSQTLTSPTADSLSTPNKAPASSSSQQNGNDLIELLTSSEAASDAPLPSSPADQLVLSSPIDVPTGSPDPSLLPHSAEHAVPNFNGGSSIEVDTSSLTTSLPAYRLKEPGLSNWHHTKRQEQRESGSPSASPASYPVSPRQEEDDEEEFIVDEEGRTSQYKSEFYDNGDSYMGYMLNGVKHGRGVYLFGNSSQYKGNWCNGVMHGWGVFMEQETGDRFEGEWVDGERSFGSYHYSNGDTYHGGFLDNKKQGRGVVWEKRLMYEVVYDQDVCVEKCLWSLVGSREAMRQKAFEDTLAAQSELVDATLSANQRLESHNAALTEKVQRLEAEVAKLQELLKGRKGATGSVAPSPNPHTHPHHKRKDVGGRSSSLAGPSTPSDGSGPGRRRSARASQSKTGAGQLREELEGTRARLSLASLEEEVGLQQALRPAVSPWDNGAPPEVDPRLFISTLEDDACSFDSLEGHSSDARLQSDLLTATPTSERLQPRSPQAVNASPRHAHSQTSSPGARDSSAAEPGLEIFGSPARTGCGPTGCAAPTEAPPPDLEEDHPEHQGADVLGGEARMFLSDSPNVLQQQENLLEPPVAFGNVPAPECETVPAVSPEAQQQLPGILTASGAAFPLVSALSSARPLHSSNAPSSDRGPQVRRRARSAGCSTRRSNAATTTTTTTTTPRAAAVSKHSRDRVAHGKKARPSPKKKVLRTGHFMVSTTSSVAKSQSPLHSGKALGNSTTPRGSAAPPPLTPADASVQSDGEHADALDSDGSPGGPGGPCGRASPKAGSGSARTPKTDRKSPRMDDWNIYNMTTESMVEHFRYYNPPPVSSNVSPSSFPRHSSGSSTGTGMTSSAASASTPRA